MIKKVFKIFTFFMVILFDNQIYANSIPQQIDNVFKPIADFFDALVFYKISILGVSIPIILILLTFGAILFTIRFRFPNIRFFKMAIDIVRGKYDEMDAHHVQEKATNFNVVEGDIKGTIADESRQGEVSHFQALATAVSGTVGLGNIAGVAVAIAMGGAGATFWMIVCGFLGMSSKFVECILAVKYREIDKDGIVYGGPMYYLKNGLNDSNKSRLGVFLSFVFAILCVGASFGAGNAFQSNQAAIQIVSLFQFQNPMATFIVGIAMSFVIGLVIIGGIKRIAKITEKIVPLMAIIYIVASLIIIFFHWNKIPLAINAIWTGAFSLDAGIGGLIGVMIVGFQRAAFSNEAGAGSAAIAHAAVKTRFPASEGIVALLEPFIDTVVICTMTALVIVLFNIDGKFDYGTAQNGLIYIKSSQQWVGGVDLTSLAYADVMPWFTYVLTIAIVLFAFSTMISWSYYGLQAWKFLFGKGKMADLVYKILFVLFVIVGASTSMTSVVKFSDAMMLGLVFPNMIGLILLFPKVKTELDHYLAAIKLFKKSKN